MKPGRELDALVAERVMGFSAPFALDGTGPYRQGEIRRYSTDIAAAWEVVEWMRYKSGIGYLLTLYQNGSETWGAEFGEPTFRATEDTAPHAICVAALKAVNAI